MAWNSDFGLFVWLVFRLKIKPRAWCMLSEHTISKLNAMPMVMEPHIYFMFTAEEDSSGEAKH